MSKLFAEVAVDAPISTKLTYEIPLELSELNVGDSVVVPLGSRKVKGLVFKISNVAPETEFKIKAILQIESSRLRIPKEYLEWLHWISKYYMHPIGQVAALCFPPLKKNEKQRRSKKTPAVPTLELSTPPELTDEQIKCVEDILSFPNFQPHLLHGVTGSGKTEVYLHIIDQVLKQNKRALVLVPEISLTPQLLHRFSSRFPDQVAVIHSHLTPREKTNQWWSMLDRKKNILIGARSALFCPIDDLGIIIMDEEHEPSFKQDEKLKYHARDSAVVLAQKLNCPIILGSATPSLETWQNSNHGKFKLHTMKARVADRQMPNIQVVDMRDERQLRREESCDLPFWLSSQLYKEMVHTLQKKEQVALFLNRRGIAQTVVCPDCGHVHECPNCAITLTLHAHKHLVCHYCDYTEELKETCNMCATGEPTPLGLGTELLENDLTKLFPDARIARADRDEITNRESLENLISNMENGDIDILIGTQMIAKGLDFKGLTLVGLVMADVGFNMPDFRATERSFQLLTQVSGRSGRHSEEPGRVIIQTYNPAHPSIIFSKTNDYIGFAKDELIQREELSYPPFGKVASIRLQGLHESRVSMAAEQMCDRAYSLKKKFPDYDPVIILGPTEAPMAKLRGKYRHQLLLKCSHHQILKQFCEQLFFDLKWVPTGTKVQIDIDPISML